MKKVLCSVCGKRVTADEVALNQRLLGMQIGSFCCTKCLADRLNTTPEHLRKLIMRFKEMGCAYFTRIAEVSPDEKTNDSM